MATNKPHAPPQSWPLDDLDDLRKLYPVTSIDDLVIRFKRSKTSINKAASRLGLKKAEEWKLQNCNRYAIGKKLRELNRAFYIEEFSEAEQNTLRALAHQGKIIRKGYSFVPGRTDPVRMYRASDELLTIEQEVVYIWSDILTAFMNEIWPITSAWGTARIIKQAF